MNKLFVAAMAALVSFNAFACKDSMKFTDDKQLHAGAEFVLGAASRSVIKSNTTAFAVAMVPGVLKEIGDMYGNGCASWNDLAWDAIGAFVGVNTTHFIVGPNKIVFRTEW